MRKTTVRLLTASAGAAAAAALGYAAYASTEWLRFGHAAGETDNPHLDRFLPRFDIAETHEIAVAAPATDTFDAACGVDLRRSPVVRAIFRCRELFMRARRADAPRRLFLDEMLSLGWGILIREPGRRIVLGAVTQPWMANVKFTAIPPEKFAAFGDSGFAKIVWTLEAQPVTESSSIFRTETRAVTTDPESRRRFRRYWSLASPGIRLIRCEALRLVKAAAERIAPGGVTTASASISPR